MKTISQENPTENTVLKGSPTAFAKKVNYLVDSLSINSDEKTSPKMVKDLNQVGLSFSGLKDKTISKATHSKAIKSFIE
jgi:hypothetical protein